MVYIIGLFTYFTHIAVHYLSYTVHQISLYGSVQSQQSLFIAYWLYINVYKRKLLPIIHHVTVE